MTHRSEIVVGRLPVLACLQAGKRRAETLYIYRGATDIHSILDNAGHTPVKRVERKALDQLSGGVVHQGVVLRAAPLQVLSLDDWLCAHVEPEQALVILDGIQDPQNFGGIARSAAACGAAGILFAKDRAAPITAAAMKAAAGGMEYIDLVQVTNLARALVRLKEGGFWLAALDAGATQPLWDANLKGRIAFIIGSEGEGIRHLVRQQADFALSIPIAGEIASLNASVSAGIILAEWLRQHRRD